MLSLCYIVRCVYVLMLCAALLCSLSVLHCVLCCCAHAVLCCCPVGGSGWGIKFEMADMVNDTTYNIISQYHRVIGVLMGIRQWCGRWYGLVISSVPPYQSPNPLISMRSRSRSAHSPISPKRVQYQVAMEDCAFDYNQCYHPVSRKTGEMRTGVCSRQKQKRKKV